ncbi:MAG TPA: hypothetical protein DG753_02185 [Clostridium sp.]|nr:hypothetical protein [Clostridium sp.]
MKQRLNYLDITKGFSIALVVLGHIIPPGNTSLRNWIYSFHIPIFFIISGYLINLSKDVIPIPKFIQKKFNALIIPYISFALINYFFIMYNLYIKQELDQKTLIIYFIYIIKFCGRSAIWFLPCLFISEVLFKLLTHKVSNNHLRLIIIFSLFIIPFFIKADSDTLLLVLLRSFTALGFIAIGNLLYKPITNINSSFFTLLILFITNVFLALFNGPVDLFALKFNNIIIYIINSIIGSLALILLSKKVSFSVFFKYIGKNSLIIMGTHILTINLVNTFLIDTLSLNLAYTYPSRYHALLFSIVLLIEVPIIFVFNNYLNFTLGKTNLLNTLNHHKKQATNQ